MSNVISEEDAKNTFQSLFPKTMIQNLAALSGKNYGHSNKTTVPIPAATTSRVRQILKRDIN